MATVDDICDYLHCIAPTELKMEWDNVGLLCGDPNKKVKKIMIALDPFEGVCQEAANWGADVLLTHHPLIYRPLTHITSDNTTGRCINTLIQNSIAAINAHTNLDIVSGGVNDCLASVLGLQNIHVVPSSHGYDLLRSGTVTPSTAEKFSSFVKAALGCKGVRYVDAGIPVQKVCVGGGACGDGISDALAAGCDTLVTSDIKYNQFWDAKTLGINLIDAGHFFTENPVCKMLQLQFSEKFPDIIVKISETHEDPVKFL